MHSVHLLCSRDLLKRQCLLRIRKRSRTSRRKFCALSLASSKPPSYFFLAFCSIYYKYLLIMGRIYFQGKLYSDISYKLHSETCSTNLLLRSVATLIYFRSVDVFHIVHCSCGVKQYFFLVKHTEFLVCRN